MGRDCAASLVGQQFGDYRIDGILGRGGMGAVLRGRDLKLDRDVALKIIGQEFGGEAGEAWAPARDRFLREAKTLAGLAHPHLVHLYAVGEVDGKQFFAMELVRGPTLGDWIQRFGPLREGAAVRFSAQMLSALQAVHAGGFIHRDIKPGNMMLDCSAVLAGPLDPARPVIDQLAGEEANTGRWVLMDFGLAKAAAGLDSSLTQQGLILGTPDTMSPEQAESLAVTPVSDLYSFGVVLFLALSGRLPFTAPSAMGVMQKHLMEPPPGLEKFWKEAPGVWRETVARSLEKEPAKRFQSAAEFAAALVGRVDDLPELRELARAQRRGPPAGARTVLQPVPGTAPTTTALLDSPPDAAGPTGANASARTVSSTAQTIRDRAPAPPPAPPASVNTSAVTAAQPAKAPRRKTGPRPTLKPGTAATAPANVTDTSTAKTALLNRPAPPPARRWPYLAVVLLLVLILLAWAFWPPAPPPPPPVKLEPLPANAFYGHDPNRPDKRVALHWVGLDPTTQTYEVEIFNEQTKQWEEQTLSHEQMMQYGDLKKPPADDPQFPRGPTVPAD